MQTRDDVIRILAVDDEEAVLSLYREILEELPDREGPPYEVVLSPSGEEAVAQIKKSRHDDNPFAVVFLDVRMPPGMDGITTAREIRKLDQDVELVIVTAYSDIEPGEIARMVRPPEKLLYIQKPFHIPEIRQFAASLSSKWIAERDLRNLNKQLQVRVDERTAELSRAYDDLKASEEWYRLLFEEDITGNFVASASGRVLDCNSSFARIIGLPDPEAARGFDLGTLVSETLGHEPLPRLVHKKRRIDPVEAEFTRPDGTTVWVVAKFIGVIDEQGGLQEIRGHLFDITERKRLGEQLRQAQKLEALGTLAGGIAHDFNNILGVMLGYAELIMEGAGDRKGVERRIGEILNAGNRARDLVDQILNFSRQGSSKAKPMAVTPLIKETIRFMRSSLPSNIEIQSSILTENDTVIADPSQVHQVLMNLCTNAGYAMRDNGGLLDIGLVEAMVDESAAREHAGLAPGQYLRLTVADNGMGMDEHVMERIFDPFFTTKGQLEGTGMGLAVVHGIVKGHGGDVLVSSKVGQGTVFQVFLPQAEPASEQDADLDYASMRFSGKVLLVDDEKALVDIGNELLTGLGFDVMARTSSIEALEAFRHMPERFDLVVTDQTMPNMTGLEMAHRIRDVRPDLPIILCTGFSEVVSEESAKAAGVRQILLKPILKHRMLQALASVCS